VTNVECGSGRCADGYCCDGACTGQCQACDVPGKLGRCVPVAGKPHGARIACAVAGAPCESSVCDGTDGSRCAAFVGSDVVCRAPRCVDGSLSTTATCRGTGDCPEPVKVSCSPFACAADGTACATKCATLDDCAPGLLCKDGACISPEARCDADGRSVIDASGRKASCAPLVCRDSVCLERCESTPDCVPGTVCDGAGRCVLAPAVASAETDAGGCTTTRARASPFWILVLVLVAVSERRRRSPQRGRRPGGSS
jgi:hypothetical protein